MQVINTLALSQLLYVSSVIETPVKVFKEIKLLITDFIWEGKTSKISYNTMIQTIENGGSGLTNLETKCNALMYNWINRYCNNEETW